MKLSIRENLDRDELKACLKLVLYIAKLDNDVRDEETLFFENLARECGLSNPEICDLEIEMLCGKETGKEIAKQIKSKQAKVAIIADLIDLCFADGEYSSIEKEAIRYVAHLLKVKRGTVEEIESEIISARRQEELRKEAEILRKNLVKFGKKGIKAGLSLGKTIAKGLGAANTKISETFASAKKLKQENEELRRMVKENAISDAAKQKIIISLNQKIEETNALLKAEQEKNDANEEMIILLNEQLNDLILTLDDAENARIA